MQYERKIVLLKRCVEIANGYKPAYSITPTRSLRVRRNLGLTPAEPGDRSNKFTGILMFSGEKKVDYHKLRIAPETIGLFYTNPNEVYAGEEYFGEVKRLEDFILKVFEDLGFNCRITISKYIIQKDKVHKYINSSGVGAYEITHYVRIKSKFVKEKIIFYSRDYIQEYVPHMDYKRILDELNKFYDTRKPFDKNLPPEVLDFLEKYIE